MTAEVATSGPTESARVVDDAARRRTDEWRGGHRGHWWHRGRLSVAIVLVGLIVTGAASWIAWRIERNNQHRLLVVQTRQAATVVASAVTAIETPLQRGLDVAAATGGRPEAFSHNLAASVGPGGLFVSASLWRVGGPAPIATTGAAPELAAAPTRALIAQAAQRGGFVVTVVPSGGAGRLAYALASAQDPGYVVSAERVIPANRRVPVESSAAFSDLHFATYLGPTTDTAALQTTDLPTSHLPLTGDTARETIPFGNTSLTLVTSPAGDLGGALGAELPWILLVGGIALTFVAALVGGQLELRRTEAESDAQTITSLYGRLDDLYREQRTIAETLQRALIPQTNPTLPDVTVASRYVAGAHGVDVGGDWFSVIRLDEAHFGFVVGDVSGRGVDAAALMARIRFTLRAYLFEGHSPDEVLQMCARQVDIDEDRHFATVLVGIADLRSRRVVLANAGHLSPLIVSGAHPEYAVTVPGLPLGIRDGEGRPGTYPTTTIDMSPGSMLLAFTDGLVERHGEEIDRGLHRLAAAASSPVEDLDAVLSDLLAAQLDDDCEDDVALLAFRWGSSPSG